MNSINYFPTHVCKLSVRLFHSQHCSCLYEAETQSKAVCVILFLKRGTHTLSIKLFMLGTQGFNEYPSIFPHFLEFPIVVPAIKGWRSSLFKWSPEFLLGWGTLSYSCHIPNTAFRERLGSFYVDVAYFISRPSTGPPFEWRRHRSSGTHTNHNMNTHGPLTPQSPWSLLQHNLSHSIRLISTAVGIILTQSI